MLNEFFYTRIYDDMSTQVKTLVQKGIRVLIYNGDVDSVCNVIMNGKFLFLYKFFKSLNSSIVYKCYKLFSFIK